MPERVAIVGLGYGLPGLWNGAAWASLARGESHVRPLPDDLAATWRLDRWPGISPADWRIAAPGKTASQRRLTASHLVGLATGAAVREAGLSGSDSTVRTDSTVRSGSTSRSASSSQSHAASSHDPARTGLVIGGSKGRLGPPLGALAQQSFPGLLAPDAALAAAAVHVAAEYATCPVAACATGLVSLVQAARWIRWGHCDRVVAGSGDAGLCGPVLASYRRLGVLSGSPQPFAADRDGFVIGEGAAVLVLEREAVARGRGVAPLAYWSGEDLRADAAGLVAASPDGEAVAVTIEGALKSADLSPSAIDAISLHGTGTRQNDASEAAGLAAVFGSRLRAIPAFSVKGGWGHTLGAAGALEAAVCVQMLRTQTVPPHLSAASPVGDRFACDPDCGDLLLPSRATSSPLRHVLTLSLGFGGHIAAGVLSRA